MNKNNKNVDIDELMTRIAHQWRQPLSQINSIIFVIDSILQKKGIVDEELETKLSEIEVLTKYMSNTIEVLNKNHETDKKEEPFYIHSIIHELKLIIKSNLEYKHIKIDSDIDPSLRCIGNSNGLLQVLLIISNNAIDVLVERNVFNAKIFISTKNEDTNCLVQIKDNGGGMTKKTMQKIFNIDFTTKHKSEGSGIGLNMSKKIIDEYPNAELNVKNCDTGTCFEIRLKKFI